MSLDADFAFAQELFGPLGAITGRKMFGGMAIYADGAIFALLAFDRIYVKADAALAADLEDAGAEQFIYDGKGGKPARMGYWTLPDAALDDADAALEWGRRALAVGRAAQTTQKTTLKTAAKTATAQKTAAKTAKATVKKTAPIEARKAAKK